VGWWLKTGGIYGHTCLGLKKFSDKNFDPHGGNLPGHEAIKNALTIDGYPMFLKI
jgi:hypothetical protein